MTARIEGAVDIF